MGFSNRAAFISRKRIRITFLSFSLFAVLLCSNLLKLQVAYHTYYQNKVYEQITTSTRLRAERGIIYDRNLNILATTNTTWRLFAFARDILQKTQEDGIDYAQIIADGCAEFLSLDKETVYSKIKNSSVSDVTIATSLSEEEYQSILAFSHAKGLDAFLATEAQNCRYYPMQTSFAHLTFGLSQ